MSTAIADDPRSSVRRVAQETGKSTGTAYRIMRHAIGVFPYKISKTFKQQDTDKQRRVDFCNWLHAKVDEDQQFLDNVWWTDESHIWLDGVFCVMPVNVCVQDM